MASPDFAKCIARVIEETGTVLSRSAVQEVMETLLEDRGIAQRKGKAKDYADLTNEQQRVHDDLTAPSINAKLAQARDDMVSRINLIAAQQKLNIVNNALKRNDRYKTYSAAPNARLGLQAKLIGTNTPFEGSRNSTEAAIKGKQFSIIAPFAKELKDAGLEDLFISRTLETEWAKELGNLNRTDQGPKQPVTGNKQALAMAEIVQRAQQRALKGLRDAGSWIGNYDGYIARTAHSADRIAKMGVEAWTALAKRTFDLDTIYPNASASEIAAALGEQWKRISTGIHTQFSPGDAELMSHIPGQNLAKRTSESRSIHFKDSDSWLAYMREASDHTPTSVVMSSLMRGGRDAGLMDVWGTNPKAAFLRDLQDLITQAGQKGDHAGVKALRGEENNYKRWFGLMDGELGIPVNELAARITQNYLALQRTAKLGFLPFAMLTHLGTVHGELRYQGVPFFRRVTDSLLTLVPEGPVKGEVVENILSEFYWLTGEMHSLLEGNDMRLGGRFTRGVTQLQNTMFKYMGAQWFNSRLRKSHVAQMATHFGRLRDSEWSEIGPREQRIMKGFDIAEPEWNALTHPGTPWLKPKGADQAFLTPDAAQRIPDAAIVKMLEDRGQFVTDAKGQRRPWRDDELSRARDDLSQKIYRYYADRVDFGAWGHGVGERAILTQGGRPGSALGIGLSIVSQYKSFAVFMLRRTLGRDIYGSSGPVEAISGITQMIVGTAILGIFQNALTQMLKGQDPQAQWRDNPTAAMGNAMLRGGGASILGDFLFSEYNRFDKTAVEWLAGPSAANVNTLVSIPHHLIGAKDNPTGDVLDMIRGNLPMTNLFYTKMAMDYLIWNGLTEWAHPGYLARAERRLKKNQGLEYMKWPINTSPQHMNAWGR